MVWWCGVGRLLYRPSQFYSGGLTGSRAWAQGMPHVSSNNHWIPYRDISFKYSAIFVDHLNTKNIAFVNNYNGQNLCFLAKLFISFKMMMTHKIFLCSVDFLSKQCITSHVNGLQKYCKIFFTWTFQFVSTYENPTLPSPVPSTN